MMYQNQPNYYGMNGAVPDNLSQLRINQNQQLAGQAPAPLPVQQQTNPIIWVSGEAGAKSYLVAPNTTVMLMDAENSTFYLKSSDASGMPLPLRVFDYTERIVAPRQVPQASNTRSEEYITRQEFERLASRVESMMQKPKKTTAVKEDTQDAKSTL